ncbi:MAG: hypothetical protein ABJO09_09735 [Hyphomicrobiales bacterium]
MKMILPTVFSVAFALSGCLDSGVATNPQAQQSLVTQECAIYFAAEERLAAEGRPVARMSNGCAPGIAPANIAPTGVAGQSTSFSEILFKRMIARGMPQDVAVDISTSAAFKTLVDFQAANIG